MEELNRQNFYNSAAEPDWNLLKLANCETMFVKIPHVAAQLDFLEP